MCGIAGVFRQGTTPITEEELAILVCSLEHRGNHATGMAIVNDDGLSIHVHKLPGPAWNFCRHASTEGFLKEHFRAETNMVLLHTRFYTVGDPANNGNNHPMFAGKTAVVHNGSIRNHTELFRASGLKRHAETDSDFIRAVFDEDGFTEKAAKELSKAGGSAAIAAVNPDYPGVLALGRSGSPIKIASANDKLYFASELQAIHKAVRPYERRHGLWMRGKALNFAYDSMNDNTLYYLYPDGTSEHYVLNITNTYVAPVYKSHDTYAEKMRTWKVAKKPSRIFCKCADCGTVQSKFEATPWANTVCGNDKCGKSLYYFEKAVVNA